MRASIVACLVLLGAGSVSCSPAAWDACTAFSNTVTALAPSFSVCLTEPDTRAACVCGAEVARELRRRLRVQHDLVDSCPEVARLAHEMLDAQAARCPETRAFHLRQDSTECRTFWFDGIGGNPSPIKCSGRCVSCPQGVVRAFTRDLLDRACCAAYRE